MQFFSARWWMAAGVAVGVSGAAMAGLPAISQDPYVGAIVVEAESGRVLFEDHADAACYPASVVKLMDLLILLERIEQGRMRLDESLTVGREAAGIGGSQVYLAEKEVFSIDDLVYALIIQSANDAAVALAVHAAGSKEAFVQLMNQRAQALGMTSTRYYSVHGLPPGKDQQPDVSTPRDLARLACELLRRPDTIRYSSTRERPFRNGKFMMRTHNHLLGAVEGCDGLKTGYFTAGGFSIVATAQRSGRRVVAVVLGSKSREARDAAAREWLARGFAALPPLPPRPAVTNAPAATNAAAARAPAAVAPGPACGRKTIWCVAGGAIVLIVVLTCAVGYMMRRRP
jgi:D-alanyl-D-alanine carboxypeptidase (penicillin-binding protein 5/6)